MQKYNSLRPFECRDCSKKIIHEVKNSQEPTDIIRSSALGIGENSPLVDNSLRIVFSNHDICVLKMSMGYIM